MASTDNTAQTARRDHSGAQNGPQEPLNAPPGSRAPQTPHAPSGGSPETQNEAPAPDRPLTVEEGAALMGAPVQHGGTPAAAPVEDDEQAVAERFAADVAQHKMTVLLDQPPYRHLHFAAPGPNAWMHWFEVVTWPGSIAIHGDMESFAATDGRKTFMHARTEDMFEFFRGKSINPDYWSQKVSGGSGVKEFSDSVFRDEVLEYAKDAAGHYPGLIEAVREQIFDESVCCAERAFALLDEFDHEDFYFYDFTERDFTKFSTHYLWCLHAIVWAIAWYDAAKKAEPEFFKPGRTYAREHHGDTIHFTVDHLSTSPDGAHRVACGWRQRSYSDGWEPTDSDDFTGWTEVIETAAVTA